MPKFNFSISIALTRTYNGCTYIYSYFNNLYWIYFLVMLLFLPLTFYNIATRVLVAWHFCRLRVDNPFMQTFFCLHLPLIVRNIFRAVHFWISLVFKTSFLCSSIMCIKSCIFCNDRWLNVTTCRSLTNVVIICCCGGCFYGIIWLVGSCYSN